MLSEAFWMPNIASSQLDENSQLGSQRKVRPVKNQLGSPNSSNWVREQTFAQLRTGLRLITDGRMEVGVRGRLCIYRHTVSPRMTPALKWAAMRAILMCYFINREGQSHKTMSTNHNLLEQKGQPKRNRAEALLLTRLTPYR